MAEAINYTLNQWRELTLFTSDPAVPLHNNLAEQQMKRIALLRKNALFAGSPRGGDPQQPDEHVSPARDQPPGVSDALAGQPARHAHQPRRRLAARSLETKNRHHARAVIPLATLTARPTADSQGAVHSTLTLFERVVGQRWVSQNRASGGSASVAPWIRGNEGRTATVSPVTADVAHELRTPVAEIRAIAEVTLSRLRDPQEYQHAIRDIHDTIKTLQAMIEKLLVLARLEAGQIQPELESIILADILTERWDMVQPLAQARGITLENRSPLDTVVTADPGLLEMTLSNALSNAAEYAHKDSNIIVETRLVGGRPQVTIANSGCQLSPDDVARAFERFWRADTARGRSGLNCGLGLTLVRRAMEAMGGKANAIVDDHQRFALTLTFPPNESDD